MLYSSEVLKDEQISHQVIPAASFTDHTIKPGRCPSGTASQEPSPFTVLNTAQAKLQGTLQHIHIHLAPALETDLHRGWLTKGFSPLALSAVHSTAEMGWFKMGPHSEGGHAPYKPAKVFPG